MITVRKLLSLKDGTRQRKIIRILRDWEEDLVRGRFPDSRYFSDFCHALEHEPSWKEYTRQYGVTLPQPESTRNEYRVFLNRLRHVFLADMDMHPSEWDLLHPSDEDQASEERRIFPARLYLDDIRSPFNLGSVFRTAECLGVREIFLSPGCADPSHPRALRTAMGCIDKVPWSTMPIEELSQRDEEIFALELGGTMLGEYQFPGEGILILGSEELGVSPECLSLAEQSGGTVSIPLFGRKASLNVSVAFGILMNAWAERLSGEGRSQSLSD